MNKFVIDNDQVWISLTRGKQTRVSLTDWEKVRLLKWTLVQGRSGLWYVRNRKVGYLHLFLLETGRADHRDGDGLNNLRTNIRACTQSQNCQNRRRAANNTSGLKGVCRNGKNWIARIVIGVGQNKLNLGTYSDKNEAGRQYDRAAIAHFGEFASLNFSN